MIETCANCGRTVNWGSLFRKIEGKKRTCPHCKKDFDVQPWIEEDGTLHLDRLMRGKRR